jgi:hypothetical protein
MLVALKKWNATTKSFWWRSVEVGRHHYVGPTELVESNSVVVFQ